MCTPMSYAGSAHGLLDSWFRIDVMICSVRAGMSAFEHLHCICTMFASELIGFVQDLPQLDAYLRGKVVVFTALDV